MTVAVIVYLYYSDEVCASPSPSETPFRKFMSSEAAFGRASWHAQSACFRVAYKDDLPRI
jgi:hypothetical protein